LDVAVETGLPLVVEANDEAVETTAVDAVDVGEPGVDHLGSVGDECLDVVGLESDFEEVMGVLVHFKVDNAHSHGYENDKKVWGFVWISKMKGFWSQGTRK